MWVTFVIAAAFFAALVAIAYFAFQEHGDRFFAEADAPAPGEPVAGADCCGACSAPLRRGATRDQIVFEIEHRIHADLRDVAHALRSPAEPFNRTIRA